MTDHPRTGLGRESAPPAPAPPAPAPALDPGTDLLPSVEACDAAEWARLGRGRSLYVSRPYLAYAERCHQDEAAYVVCRAQGRVVAALPAYDCAWPDAELDAYDYQDQYGGLSALAGVDRALWYPGMLGGTRSGYVTDPLLDPALGEPRQREATRRLLRGFRELAAARGARSAALLYLTSDAARTVSASLTEEEARDDERAPLLLSPFGVDTWLPVEFATFEDYVRHLSSKRRHAVRREIAAFRAQDRRVEVIRLGECHEALGPLLANVQRKYGHQSTAARMTDLLDQYTRVLDDESRVFLCRGPDGDLLGYALYFAWEGVLYARNVGFDYERLSGDDGTYFNLLFYEPIAFAIRHGYRAVHFGMGSRAKAARGALIRPLWSLLLPPEGTRVPSRGEADAWNAARRDQWAQEYRGFGAQLPDAEWGRTGGL
ncbi:GNAT family N-acetyltransferase [Streptomyces sp. AN091965]|uniref:GNAT family N-acetyltransferase n=1 Tax=Streptomyces sp. AN091965 TaxID=2927803 RepID=UPI001F61E2AD|nr:GNAT family N-acetyltransferase [Streptomyces sp. AN091965]MCI3934997.1 GNAT family N-acetyltransferase [Streptomyces sp. AN091965]